MSKTKLPNLIKAIYLSILLTLVSPIAARAEITYLQPGFKQPKPFLYEVEKDGKVSHILGSMHMGIPLSSYPDNIFQLSADASRLVFEIDPNDPKLQKQKGKQLASKYPIGESLEQNLSPKAIQKLKEIFGEKGFAKLKNYKPHVIETQLSLISMAVMKKMGVSDSLLNGNLGVDMTLLKQSKKMNKLVTYLDDPSKAINSFEEETSAADLEKLLSYPDPVGFKISCTATAQRAYLAGNEDGFKVYNKSCENKKFLSNLQDRTISWIPKMEPVLKDGNAFIVVGADHMNGPNGIEALLTAKGFKVKRIGSTQPSTQYYSNPVYYSAPSVR